MSTNLSASIKKLRTASSTLNQLSDSTNETVRVIEETLRDEFRIGTPAFVKVRQEEDFRIFLEYRKIGSQFRIAVVWLNEYEEESVKPWSDCTRSIKIETIKFLPALIAELTKKIDSQIEDAKAAAIAAGEVLVSISGVK